MADEGIIEVTSVRQSDSIHHVFLGANKDKGHDTTRGVDCYCEPEINIVRVADEVIRLFVHDYKARPCQ